MDMNRYEGPLFSTTTGGHTFEVWRDREPGGTFGFEFLGFCDGVRSVSSDRPDGALSGLVRKHLVGLPEGELVDFQTAAARLRDRKS